MVRANHAIHGSLLRLDLPKSLSLKLLVSPAPLCVRQASKPVLFVQLQDKYSTTKINYWQGKQASQLQLPVPTFPLF